MAEFELRVLGSFGLLARGKSVDLPAKARELIAFLATRARRRANRLQLSAALWPDSRDARALKNLSTTLWRIRRAMRDGAQGSLFTTSGSEVSLDALRVSVDYWDFDQSVTRAVEHDDRESALRAVSLYRGSLLEGEAESEWILTERERMRVRYNDVLRCGARALARNGDQRSALRMYERLLLEDPLDEEACREAMALNHALGHSTVALRLYEDLSQRLRSDLSAEPEAETMYLLETIKAGRAPAMTRIPETLTSAGVSLERQLPLIGRTVEVGSLTRLLSQVSDGEMCVAGIEGEAGIGKTKIVAEFTRVAEQMGCKVAQSAFDAVPRALPYSVFQRIFDGTVTETSGLSERSASGLRSMSITGGRAQNLKVASEERARFIEAIASSLRDRAQPDPLVVIVEDIHFADAASVEALWLIARLLVDCRILFLLTWRPEDLSLRIARVMQPGRLPRIVIKLERLDRTAIRSMCTAFFGTVPPSILADLVFRQSEGNPLFALEVLRSVDLSGRLFSHPVSALGRQKGYASAAVRANSQTLPIGIRAAVRKRLERLPSQAKRLLQFASACGKELDTELLSRATGLSTEQLTGALKFLVRFGFIMQQGSGYVFLHDKVRAFCYEEMSLVFRKRVHEVLLRTLERTRPDRINELALHSENAGEHGKAVEWWEEFGDRATAVWAHEDAIVAYSKALENMALSNVEGLKIHQYDLLKKRAGAWELLGRIERGESDIEEMLGLANAVADNHKFCEATILRSRLWLRRGLPGQAAEAARAALRLAEDLREEVLTARAREALAFASYRSGNYGQAKRMFSELIPQLERLGESEGLERVWNRLASLQAGAGDMDCLASLDIAERHSRGDLNERARRNLLRGTTFAFGGRVEEALLAFRLSEADFRRAGNSSGQALSNVGLAFVHGCAGDFASATRRARLGLPFRCGKSDAYWRIVSSTNLCHGFLLPIGNYALAKRLTLKALGLLPQIEGRARGNLLDLSAVIHLEQGDIEAAHSYACDALRAVIEESSPTIGPLLLTLGRVNLALGHADRAADLLRSAMDDLSSGSGYLELTQTLSYLGLACAALGRRDEALASFRRAMKLLRQHDGFSFRPQEVMWHYFQALYEVSDVEALQVLDTAHRTVMRLASRLGHKARARFLLLQPNRDIVDSWERIRGRGRSFRAPLDILFPQILAVSPSRVSLVIPRTGAPWGRPLRPDDTVEAILTVDSGKADTRLKEQKGEVGVRRARIIRLCAEANVQGGDPREEDLARALGVSTRTIRGDVAFLRNQGCSLQTRGANLH